eukprot:scaffold808_cov196-Alexandrium_tamarense.AAC.98
MSFNCLVLTLVRSFAVSVVMHFFFVLKAPFRSFDELYNNDETHEIEAARQMNCEMMNIFNRI